MTFINNVSNESKNKTTASIQFNLLPFYTKIKTSILLRVGIKKPSQKKTQPIKDKHHYFTTPLIDLF